MTSPCIQPPVLLSTTMMTPMKSLRAVVYESVSKALFKLTVQKKNRDRIVVQSFLIAPRSTNGANGNPFAIAQLNGLDGQIRMGSAVGGGSFADVYMGYWDTVATSTKVAIKVLRSHMYSEANIPKLEKRLRREIRIWGNLDHPNIVSLFGVTFDFGKCPAMVCEWMNQGTLTKYLEEAKDNLNFQRRLDICMAIANGLAFRESFFKVVFTSTDHPYLLSLVHSKNVIHGDLTPANILMNNDVAHLCDFGLSNVIAELQGPSFITPTAGGSARWKAPELLEASDNIAPKLAMPCDIYSFASVAFYVITGRLPFEELKHDYQIVAKILGRKEEYLSRPVQSLLTNECWEILTMCWQKDPAQRPDINNVKHRLQELRFP